MTLIPLKLYFNEKGRAKLELALARGKKLYDKTLVGARAWPIVATKGVNGRQDRRFGRQFAKFRGMILPCPFTRRCLQIGLGCWL